MAALGGKVAKDPFDVFDVGRMAVVEDPPGATFAIWQPRKHAGAHIVNQPGTLCWNELMTKDVASSAKFYTELFGWKADTQKLGPIDYTTFMNGERPAGGMMAIAEDMGDIPPNWLVYFAVEDCDETLKKVESEGGKVAGPPTDVPEIGRGVGESRNFFRRW